ncbi:VOC family protein [Gimesia fumaroli]|uniref:Glyoxalase-like domain protein n=1 Tax=Gimesia fumaroli TaxID=2527976 RepID=A0A518IIN5_9PLAN|nr:VOC family protein [Gimesia fumaroli]QDV52900.1 Glyoxalase-like domain protein [Gimesia fumaroli]
MQPHPMIAVHDVEASSAWYQSLLICRSGHGGTEYEQLTANDDSLILQLHHWDVHEHPHLSDPEQPKGNGVLLWFRIDDFDDAVARAQAMSAEILDGPLVNPNANHREIWIRDPDGYVVVLAGHYGDV